MAQFAFGLTPFKKGFNTALPDNPRRGTVRGTQNSFEKGNIK